MLDHKPLTDHGLICLQVLNIDGVTGGFNFQVLK